MFPKWNIGIVRVENICHLQMKTVNYLRKLCNALIECKYANDKALKFHNAFNLLNIEYDDCNSSFSMHQIGNAAYVILDL